MTTPQDGMATVFTSSGVTAEIEAETIVGILQSNGVAAVITGMDVLPGAHDVVVQVTEDRREDAERLIREAREAGPAAADEAEAASEEIT